MSYQHAFKKIIKIGEFRCRHFNVEMEKDTQLFWCIMLYYFKEGKNANETQKQVCAVYGESAVKSGFEKFPVTIDIFAK